MVSARRLRPYFQSHPIVVLTDHPLRLILQKPEASGRRTKWSIELSEFDITYRSRPSIKAQVLADFVSEFTPVGGATSIELTPVGEADPRDIFPATIDTPKFDPNIPVWQLYMDGASNAHGSGAGIILITPHTESPETARLKCAIRFKFKTSYNKAEYKALLAGLRLAQHMGATQLQVFSDSQLIVNQVTGDYQAKDSVMSRYVTLVQNLTLGFSCFKLTKVPRAENQGADALARIASAIDPNPGEQIG
ncbi:hypothetical protein M0R45_006943 [Rubus argutus]|uniref:RNase H type-1 domain-containing protein n=1 Tax=Rubus argutus TaxID=59490 RepID=A0AAW1YSU6_RUBAR